MADFGEEEDVALRVFGTPERELRRRWLHPLGYPVSPGDEEEEGIDSNQQQPGDGEPQGEESPPPVPKPSPYKPTKIDRIAALLLHLCVAFFFIYMRLETDRVLARIKQEKGLIMPCSDTYGGRLKFFTYLNFHVQIMYFVLALLCDLLPLVPLGQKELIKFRDFIFTTIVLPCALVVTSMFWIFTLTPFLRQYAVGAEDGPVRLMLNALPPHINHTSHTAVGLVCIIEALLVYHRYPSTTDAIKTITIWNGCYALWIYWCFFYAGAFPYPLFEYLGPYLMHLCTLLFFAVATGSYFFGKTITSLCWAGEVN